MTVSTSANRADYLGNGATTSFAVPFYFPDPTNLQVLSTVVATGVSTVLVLNSDYTVTGAGVATGGTVTTTVAPASTVKLSVLLNMAYLQQTHYVPNDPFPAASHEAALDYLTLLAKQTSEVASRSVSVPPGESGSTVVLPPAPTRAGFLLGFDGTGAITLIAAAAQSASALALSLLSAAGGSLVSFVHSLVGSVQTTMLERLRREVWLEDFLTAAQIADGMTGAPTLDIAGPFQAAIDACCPLLPSTLPARKLRSNLVACIVGTTLNMTGNRVNGTRSRDGFAFEGNTQLGTQILGKTGFNHAVIETTGSQWLRLAHVYIGATGTAGAGGTASSVGIYQGLGATLTQTQNQKYERVYINMPDDATANQGLGTIGLWNFGAEENTYDNCYITANAPVFMTSYKVSPNTSAAYSFSYQTLATSHSTGVNTFSGETFLVSLNRRMPSLMTEDVNSLDLGNVYMSNIGTGGTNDVAWRQYGAVQGAKGHGTIESHGTALDVFGTVTGMHVRWTFGTITNTAAARIVLERGGAGAIVNSDFNLQDNVSPNRALLSATPSVPGEQISCYVANSTFKANCDKAFLTLQENVKWNPKTGNVSIFGLNGTLPYKYEIGYQTDRLDIPPKTCLINGGITSAEVVRVIMPTVTGASSAGMAVRLKGMLSIFTSGGTGAMSVRYIDTTVQIATAPTGTITATTPADSLATTTAANVAAAGNNITAGAVSSAAGGTSFVQIIVTPTRTGANLESVTFTGSAELIWSGNEARAPSLQLV